MHGLLEAAREDGDPCASAILEPKKSPEAATRCRNAMATAVAAPEMEDLRAPQMMCYQCEQTNAGRGCTTTGVCKKSPDTAGLQDLQMQFSFRLCQLAAIDSGPYEEQCRHLVLESLFSTLTNVNFDNLRFVHYIYQCDELIRKMEERSMGMAI